jgi:hypothetical protein
MEYLVEGVEVEFLVPVSVKKIQQTLEQLHALLDALVTYDNQHQTVAGVSKGVLSLRRDNEDVFESISPSRYFQLACQPIYSEPNDFIQSLKSLMYDAGRLEGEKEEPRLSISIFFTEESQDFEQHTMQKVTLSI